MAEPRCARGAWGLGTSERVLRAKETANTQHASEARQPAAPGGEAAEPESRGVRGAKPLGRKNNGGGVSCTRVRKYIPDSIYVRSRV